MKCYAIIHRKDETSRQVANYIRKTCMQQNIQEDELNPSTVFVIGGDGTFLHAVHRFIDQLDQVEFIGVHTGTLGFMTDYQVEELDELIQDFKDKEPVIDGVRLLSIQCGSQQYYALNEMRIENARRTQILKVLINDTYFETFRGTGMCLSTQMGSTAYNRSIRGAIIQHGLDLLQLSEIAGIHHQVFRSLGNSIILKPNSVVTFESDSFDTAVLCYDHCSANLEDIHVITCQLSNKVVKLARYRDYNYFGRLINLF